MQKILAFILSILTLLAAIFPGLVSEPVEGITQGDWIQMLDEQFGMTTYESQEPYYDYITPENPYFQYVQIAYEWGVITDEDVLKLDEFVTNEFVAVTLVRVALLALEDGEAAPQIKNAKSLQYPDEVAVAVAYGLVTLPGNGKFKVAVMAKEAALAALAKAKELWANKKFGAATMTTGAGEDVIDLSAKVDSYTVANDKVVLAAAQAADLQVGDIYILPPTAANPEGAAYRVASIAMVGGKAVITNQAVALEDVYSDLDFEGDIMPNLNAAKIVAGDGSVLQNAVLLPAGGTSQSVADLLQKLDVNFSLGKFDFGLKVVENGFNLDIGTTVCDGVRIAKSYNVSNLVISTKFDGNIALKDINEAYIRADYTLKDVTKLTGSYAASVAVDQSKLPAGAEPIDFITAAKQGLLTLVDGGGSKITVFTLNIPVGSTPITISLDVNIRISVYGKIEITIESSNVKGVEIVNNKLRVINEVEYLNETFDIMADVRFTVGLCLSVKVLGFIVVDAEFQGGIGVKVTAFIKTDAAEYVIECPLDLAIQIPYPCGGMEAPEFCGNAKVYGIMSVSVGQNSKLLKLLGLTKTWNIFDENNAVLYNFHIEETGIVPQCTRQRTR